MRKEDASTAKGISLPVVVFIVFLTLKLAKVISWSWWWVTSPLWIVAGSTILLVFYSMAVTLRRDKKRKN